jgi:CBS domain containing-hemolysin-like protein
VHIKDFFGVDPQEPFDLRAIMRAPQFVPETLPVRRLLRQFQASHQHMAFLVDEYGTTTGMITLENVLEPIIGSVEDEFDHEQPDIIAEGPLEFVVAGSISIETVNRRFGLRLVDEDVDSFSGLLMSRLDRLPAPGDRVVLDGAVAEVLSVKDRRAHQIRLTLAVAPPDPVR